MQVHFFLTIHSKAARMSQYFFRYILCISCSPVSVSCLSTKFSPPLIVFTTYHIWTCILIAFPTLIPDSLSKIIYTPSFIVMEKTIWDCVEVFAESTSDNCNFSCFTCWLANTGVCSRVPYINCYIPMVWINYLFIWKVEMEYFIFT